MPSQKFFQRFVKVVDALASRRILKREVLEDYDKAKLALHGMLVSALVRAGWDAGWIPVVEPRVPLEEPLDPSVYNPALSGRRKRHQFRPDVGYYRNGRLDIFAECMTTDEAMEHISSRDTPGYDQGKEVGWITKRDALLHFARHSSLKVSRLVICVTLPRRVRKKPPWPQFRDVGGDFFEELKPGWDALVRNLRQHVPTDLIVVEEGGVHINDARHSIRIPE